METELLIFFLLLLVIQSYIVTLINFDNLIKL